MHYVWGLCGVKSIFFAKGRIFAVAVVGAKGFFQQKNIRRIQCFINIVQLGVNHFKENNYHTKDTLLSFLQSCYSIRDETFGSVNLTEPLSCIYIAPVGGRGGGRGVTCKIN
jgi:hypothetical protein